jgi:hypothetical protein
LSKIIRIQLLVKNHQTCKFSDCGMRW